MFKRVSRILLLAGVVLAVLGLGLHEYFMITQRLHIGGLVECGLSWGLSLVLVDVIYTFAPGTLTKALMGVLMAFSNIGFLSALWILFTAPRTGTIHYEYIHFIKWVLLPPWLFINTAGAYYLLKAVKWRTSRERI